jgi:hypothetical protein
MFEVDLVGPVHGKSRDIPDPGQVLQPLFSSFPFTRIEIGEGLTAFALSHHPAYGTIPGGSCSRNTQFVMVEEEKQALLSKETV